jgi:hypothetical protein
MDRTEALALLNEHLERADRAGYADLSARVGQNIRKLESWMLRKG